MQCPRCGYQNAPDITACARCGLPAPPPPYQPEPPAWQPPPYQPPPPQPAWQPPPYQPPPQQPAWQPPPDQPPPDHYPPDARPQRHNGTALAAFIAAWLGAMVCLGYAAWAFTARRGIFADFADGATVSRSEARTSDRIDTAFLTVAGLVAVIALCLWALRLVSGRTAGGGLETTGLVAAALGVLTVVIGLVLEGRVGEGASKTGQGERGVAATVVTGCGVLLLAVSLLIAALMAGRALHAARPDDPPPKTENIRRDANW